MLPVYKADRMGPACVQLRSRKQSEFEKMLIGVKSESEDCLYLNVFTPRQHHVHGKLPVLVFIHGGAFSTGGSSAPLYNPTDLLVNGLDNQAVIVTFDYRLGVFGYAAGSALMKDSTSPVGNYGLQDQMAALEWVHKHIEHFNGDPLNITVMGHSAGAMSASYLQLVAPQLAHKWVLLSGTAFGWKWRHAESAFENKLWSRLCEQAGCDVDDVDCMRNTDAKVLNQIVVDFHGDFLFGPTIDGRLIKRDPLGMVPTNIGPTMVTVVKDEASVFVADVVHRVEDYQKLVSSLFPKHQETILAAYGTKNYGSVFQAANMALTDAMFTCPALHYHRSLSAHNQNIYFAQFEHPILVSSVATKLTTGQDYGVFHGSDLVLLFNFSAILSLPSGRQAEEMRAGLKRFMATGSPMNLERAVDREDVWSRGCQLLARGRGQCESVWGLLQGQPPLPANFGSTL